MKKLMLSALVVFCFSASASEEPLTDDQVRQRIIQSSINSYPGNCPCPYNSARNGSSCGKRSAWSRDGGYSPLCYRSDVSEDMVESWRQRNE